MVRLLHQVPPVEPAQLPDVGSRRWRLQHPHVLALGHEELEGGRGVAGRHHDVGHRVGHDLGRQLLADGTVQRHDPPEGRHRVALEGPPVGAGDVLRHGRSAGVGVLHDGDGGRASQLVHQLPGGLGVEQVEVGEHLPAVLDGGVPPPSAADVAVARPLLVRVLPVAEILHALQGQVESRRQLVGRTAGASVVEPPDDGGVVGSSVGKGGAGKATTRVVRQGAVPAELVEHGSVVGGVHDHAHVVVVLGRGADHARSTDVDRLDPGAGAERVEVAHHQVDGRDAPPVQVGDVGGVASVGQDGAVDARVQGLHPPVEHLRSTGHRLHRRGGDAQVVQGGGGAPTRHELPSQLGQATRERRQTGLVVHRQQGPHVVGIPFVAITSAMVAG